MLPVEDFPKKVVKFSRLVEVKEDAFPSPAAPWLRVHRSKQQGTETASGLEWNFFVWKQTTVGYT